MLFFVDESGKFHPASPSRYAVLAAVSLENHRARDFHCEIFRFKRGLCKVLYEEFGGFKPYGIPRDFALYKKGRDIRFGSDLPGDAEAEGKYAKIPGHKIPPTISDTSDFELKGRELLSSDMIAKCPVVVEEIIKLFRIVEYYHCKIFASISTRPGGAVDDHRLSIWYQRLIERVNLMCEEISRNEAGILVFDETDRASDIKTLNNFWRYTLGHEIGKQWHNIQTVLFADSSCTPGIELADIVAYILNAERQGRNDIRALYDEARRLCWESGNPETPPHLKYGIRIFDAAPED